MGRRHDERGLASGSQALTTRQRDGNGGQPEIGDFARPTGEAKLRIVLVGVEPRHQWIIQQVYLAAGLSPIFERCSDRSADRLSGLGDLVVVESDLSFAALHLAERVRRAGMCPVCLLLNWWSDLEWEAHQAADFVLHVPLTLTEVREVLSSTILGWTDADIAAVAAGEEIGHRVLLSQRFRISLARPVGP